jgi:hypothetical protein
VKPQGKEQNISIEFLIWVMVSFALCLKILDISIAFAIIWPISVVLGFIIFGKDRVDSGRVQRYKLRNSVMTANVEDVDYFGAELFKDSEYEKVLYVEKVKTEDEEMGLD